MSLAVCLTEHTGKGKSPCSCIIQLQRLFPGFFKYAGKRGIFHLVILILPTVFLPKTFPYCVYLFSVCRLTCCCNLKPRIHKKHTSQHFFTGIDQELIGLLPSNHTHQCIFPVLIIYQSITQTVKYFFQRCRFQTYYILSMYQHDLTGRRSPKQVTDLPHINIIRFRVSVIIQMTDSHDSSLGRTDRSYRIIGFQPLHHHGHTQTHSFLLFSVS